MAARRLKRGASKKDRRMTSGNSGIPTSSSSPIKLIGPPFSVERSLEGSLEAGEKYARKIGSLYQQRMQDWSIGPNKQRPTRHQRQMDNSHEIPLFLEGTSDESDSRHNPPPSRKKAASNSILRPIMSCQKRGTSSAAWYLGGQELKEIIHLELSRVSRAKAPSLAALRWARADTVKKLNFWFKFITNTPLRLKDTHTTHFKIST
jgi:hypothetical protein